MQKEDVFWPILGALFIFWTVAKPEDTAWVVQRKCDGGTNSERTKCIGASRPAGVFEVKLYPAGHYIVARTIEGQDGLAALLGTNLFEMQNCMIFDIDNWACDASAPAKFEIGQLRLTKTWVVQDGKFVHNFDNSIVREDYVGATHTTRIGRWLDQYGLWPR
jgi:hypothetical protein